MKVKLESVDSVLELIRDSEQLLMSISIRSFSSIDDLSGNDLWVYLRDLKFRLESIRNDPVDE